MANNTRGLSFSDINSDWKLALDPENIFWGAIPKDNGRFVLPDNLIDFYKKERKHLDSELFDFRFNEPLNCVYIDPTDRCNANCLYCYIPSRIRKHGTQMTTEELDTTMKKIEEHFERVKKKPVIVFHAAEPLLVKDIIFRAIKKYHKKFLFGIQTNALMLEKEDTDFIRKYRIGIGISLDADMKEINDRSRRTTPGKGNYEKAVKALDWFKGYEGLNVICTVTKYNVGRLSMLVKFLHKKKVPLVLLNPVRLTQERAVRLKPDDMAYSRNLIEAVDTAIELSKKTKRQIVIGNFANVILAIISPTARRMMCDISPCGGGRTFLTITANGDMVPCGEFIGFKEFSGGNIFKTSIEKAMNSMPFKKIRNRIVEKIDECNICDFRHICGSPCPAEMYARGNLYPVRNKAGVTAGELLRQNSNGMYGKAEFCEFYKEIIKHAFKLISEDKVKYILREDAIKQLEYEYKL